MTRSPASLTPVSDKGEKKKDKERTMASVDDAIDAVLAKASEGDGGKKRKLKIFNEEGMRCEYRLKLSPLEMRFKNFTIFRHLRFKMLFKISFASFLFSASRA